MRFWKTLTVSLPLKHCWSICNWFAFYHHNSEFKSHIRQFHRTMKLCIILYKLLFKYLVAHSKRAQEGQGSLTGYIETQYFVPNPEKMKSLIQALNDMQGSLKLLAVGSLILIDLYWKRQLPSPSFQYGLSCIFFSFSSHLTQGFTKLNRVTAVQFLLTQSNKKLAVFNHNRSEFYWNHTLFSIH